MVPTRLPKLLEQVLLQEDYVGVKREVLVGIPASNAGRTAAVGEKYAGDVIKYYKRFSTMTLQDVEKLLEEVKKRYNNLLVSK